MAMRVIVTDADGKALEGRAVHVQLQKMTYVSATQQEEGGENADQSIKYDTVAAADVTPGTTPATVQLTPNDAGAYRVIANFAGAKSDASATTIQVFAYGAGEADWGLSDPNAVAVKLDKQQYAIGDTANALIASPYAKADVYLAVVRNDTIYRTTLRGVSGAVHVSFKVTQAMLPNAALQAVVVRRAAPEAHPPKTLALTGVAGFTVDLAQRYLKLGIAPRDATVHPGRRPTRGLHAERARRSARARRGGGDGRERRDPAALRIPLAGSRADGVRGAADRDDLRRQPRERDA